jgi:hypothetical protein
MIAYKIVEMTNDKIKTLFHGINGSRTVPINKWIEADVKQGRDGGGERWYLVGWHTLPTKEDAEKYITRFKNRVDKLKIVKCEIKDIWNKEHSPDPVLLSRYIKFLEMV